MYSGNMVKRNTTQPTDKPSIHSVITTYRVIPFTAPEITTLSKPNKKQLRATIRLIKMV
jgi:hypothetical protein